MLRRILRRILRIITKNNAKKKKKMKINFRKVWQNLSKKNIFLVFKNSFTHKITKSKHKLIQF